MIRTAALLAWAVAATPADDATSLVWEGRGEDVGALYGASVSSAGDFDSDSHDDLVIGIPGHDRKGPMTGAAIVVSGRTGEVLATFHGEKKGDRFGHVVDGLRDVNADGFSDVIVGAPGHDGERGAVYVFLGKKGDERVVIDGEAKGDRFGWSVSAAGDVDQDGFFDFVVGAPGHDGEAGDDSGAAYVYSGKSKKKKAVELYRWEGDAEGAEFGWSVAHTEDIERDLEDAEAPDLLRQVAVGAPGGADGKGVVSIFDGLDGELAHTVEGRRRDQRFGHAVHAAGDTNSDSYGDVIVGSDSVPGGADVVSGKNGRVLRRLTPDRADMRFGWAVGGLGDVDNDSFDDVVVGAPGEFRPGDTADPDRVPFVRVYSGRTGEVLLEVKGGPLEDRFGIAVAIAGDLDVDGFDEIVIGADQDGVRTGFVEAHSLHPE